MASFQPVQTLITKNWANTDLQNWMDGFIIDRKTMQVSKNTLKFYQVEFKRFRAYCDDLGIVALQDITTAMIRSYLIHLEDTGRNPGGINAGYRAIKTLFNWYEEEVEPVDWKNPIRKIKTPRLDVQPITPVGLDDVEKLIEVCNDGTILSMRDKAILMFLLDTGLRAFELCAMDIEDLDLAIGQVIIRKGKGGKPRMVWFGKKTRKAIRAYLRERRDKCQAVWVTIDNTRLTYWGLNQMLRRRSVQAGIDKPGLHDFRRAFALNCLRGGMDVYSLQKLMGHSDLQVLRRYLAQTDNDVREAHAKAGPVDDLL
jgi:site-specific recombinase XerD